MRQYLLTELKKHLEATEKACLSALSALTTLSHIRDSHTAIYHVHVYVQCMTSIGWISVSCDYANFTDWNMLSFCG